MNKKSDVDILIEQCIQDTKNEYLEEGFVDNIKAGFNGAKEWLKADARNSFKLRNKNNIKNDRRWSARKGKVSSYAKSIANTLQDYKKSGGTLGRGMKVDDVISRLNQVAQGKYPRGKAQNSPQNQPAQEQPQQTQQKPSVQNQQQQTNSQKQQVSGQKLTQPSNNTASQNKMLNSIGGNVPQENNNQQRSETAEIPKAKGPSFKEKAGNALSTSAKKFKNTLAKGTQKVKDAVAKGYNNLKNKVSASIVKAKQRKSMDAARKEMEDFHRSLGDTGAEWEERIHESYHGSNTRGQVSMLNSIR